MAARRLPPLNEIAIIGLLLSATIAFDCSGARFAEDIDADEADRLLDLLDGLGDRLFFAEQAVSELEAMFIRKTQAARDDLLRDLSLVRQAAKSVRRVKASVDSLPDFDRVTSSLRAELLDLMRGFAAGYSSEANRLIDIARRRRGTAYDAAQTAAAYIEARARYDADVPPGFCDDAVWRARNGYTKGNEKQPPDSYGDYLLWKQLLDQAAQSGRTVLLVTNDRKIDWWDHDAAGLPVAPHSDLREEMQRVTGQGFYAITFAEFRRLAPRALLPAAKTPLVAVTLSASGIRLTSKGWDRRPTVPPWMLTALARPTTPTGLMRLVHQRQAVDATMRRLVGGVIDPYLDVHKAMRFDYLRDARTAIAGAERSTDFLARTGLLTAAARPKPWGMANPLSGIAGIQAAVLGRGLGFAVPDKLRIVNEIRSGMLLRPNPLDRYSSAAERMNFITSLHGGAVGRGGILPEMLRLVESARIFRENEVRMARMALGDDAELVGFSTISNPRIQAYAQEHGLMERPVREIIARMRDERLRGESEKDSAVTSLGAGGAQ